MAYDSANRLRTLERGNLRIRYLYDGFGQLVAEIVVDGSNVTRIDFALDETAEHPRIVGASFGGSEAELYAYGPRGLAAVRRTGTATTDRQALTDHRASVVGLVDQDARVEARAAYDAWGHRRASSGRMPTIGFAGERMGVDGLAWLRARHYAPVIGRFLQRDAVLGDPMVPASFNRFVYAGDNPMTYLDPSGHAFILAVFAVLGVATTTASFFFGPLTTAVNAPAPGDPAIAQVAEDNGKMLQNTATFAATQAVSGVALGYAMRAVAPLAGRAWSSGTQWLSRSFRSADEVGPASERMLARPFRFVDSELMPDGFDLTVEARGTLSRAGVGLDDVVYRGQTSGTFEIPGMAGRFMLPGAPRGGPVLDELGMLKFSNEVLGPGEVQLFVSTSRELVETYAGPHGVVVEIPVRELIRPATKAFTDAAGGAGRNFAVNVPGNRVIEVRVLGPGR